MRDLKADLEICEAMSGRRWYVKKRGAHPAIYADDGAPVATVSNSAQSRFPEQRIANAEGIAAAREAWPEAIRRAMVAEERVEELESTIARALDRLQEHEHEDVYGPYGFAGTRCIVDDGKLCDVVADLQAVLDKGEEG